MKTKIAFRYQMRENLKALGILYAIIYLLILLMAILRAVGRNGSMNGLEMASAIFMFVLGLNAFKTPFRFYLANSISRRTLFLGFLCSTVPTAAIMAVLDTVNHLIFTSLIHYDSIYFSVYFQHYSHTLQMPVDYLHFATESFLWCLCLYFFCALVGFFITSLYYRMNKLLKICVSIGVPGFFIFILPAIDIMTGSTVFRTLGSIIVFVLGLSDGCNPYIPMAFCLLGAIVISFLSFLLIRRATIKD